MFSQFLFDEHIKSRLMKDIKFFKENKDRLNQRVNISNEKKTNDFNVYSLVSIRTSEKILYQYSKIRCNTGYK
jgi:hypothetical protein